jgi:hypothetical protein
VPLYEPGEISPDAVGVGVGVTSCERAVVAMNMAVIRRATNHIAKLQGCRPVMQTKASKTKRETKWMLGWAGVPVVWISVQKILFT